MEELNRIDWNLVATLDALLTERSVSGAARRLGLTQPAVSRALARLRRHFGDELLVRERGGYTLTPVAQRLAPLAAEAVSATQEMLGSTDSFDPRASRREFVLASTEYGQMVLGRRIAERFAAEAPRARLVFRWPAFADQPGDPLAHVDGWLGPRDVFTDKPSTGLYADRWVCVVAADHPSVGTEIALAQVEEWGWVLPTAPKHGHEPWVKRLLAHGVELPVVGSTESFAAVPHLVAGTTRVGVVQESLVAATAEVIGVRVVPCPWPMAPLSLTLWWHPTREHDPGHRWLRGVIAECMGATAG
ncbi:MAG: LysR family transcriptional regulator [Nocardioides sp.]|uniref:LysR family transcriptional regulator n=1 Tax=Nocardioides sp. TaxID=35761 RepID=UPI0039E3A084